MADARKNWTREEIMLAFELYCTIPPREVTIENDQIILLAKTFGRTPSSVKMKLQNFKSYDPSYIADGRVGLTHGSKLDKEICANFFGAWDELVLEVAVIKESFGLPADTDNIQSDEPLLIPAGADKITQQKVRIGQSFFRRAVLSAFGNRCCMTGIVIPSLLRASHIKPWRSSNNINEKTNPQNGLLLNALHDAAFDKGYITINSNYKIVVSSEIGKYNEETRSYFDKYAG